MTTLAVPDPGEVYRFHRAHLDQLRLILGEPAAASAVTYRRVREVLAGPHDARWAAIADTLLRPTRAWAQQVGRHAAALAHAAPRDWAGELTEPLAALQTALTRADLTAANLAVAAVYTAAAPHVTPGSAAEAPAAALRELFADPAVWSWNKLLRGLHGGAPTPAQLAAQSKPTVTARLAAPTAPGRRRPPAGPNRPHRRKPQA